MINSLENLKELQCNLFLSKIGGEFSEAHALLNDQINRAITQELFLKGIRINDLNGRVLDQIIRKRASNREDSEFKSQLDPFYYMENELNPEIVKDLHSNDWKLHVDFRTYFLETEKKLDVVSKTLGKNNIFQIFFIISNNLNKILLF